MRTKYIKTLENIASLLKLKLFCEKHQESKISVEKLKLCNLCTFAKKSTILENPSGQISSFLVTGAKNIMTKYKCPNNPRDNVQITSQAQRNALVALRCFCFSLGAATL